MKRDYHLYLGQEKKEYLTLPEGWKPLHFVETEGRTPIPSIQQMTREALSNPIGTLPFQALLSRSQRTAIIVDDATRPTPVAEILEVLLSHLVDSGFSHENISIVVALGTHEAMKKEALKRDWAAVCCHGIR